jgi:predicted Zn-dependent protease
MARFMTCCTRFGCSHSTWHRRAVLGATLGAPIALAAAAVSPPAAAQGIAPTLVTIRDAETETLLRTFANPLFRASGVDPASVRTILIRDDALNAFVSTGNRLFVNSGILAKADSALELIGVLAHEAGHIRGGHLARLPEMMREAMIKSVAAMLIGVAAGVAGRSGEAGMGAMLGGQQLAQRGLMSFTRSMENAADQSALYALEQLGWSARGMTALFGRMRDQDALVEDLQDPYLRTHPLTRDRIEAVTAHLARSQYTNAPLPPGFEANFQMVRAKLRGFLEPSTVTLRRIRENDTAPPARYARGIALYRLGRTDEALRIIDGLLADQPSNPWLHELKGQVLFEGGRGAAAIPPYREAARLAPDWAPIRAALARAMIETNDTGQLRQAIGHLQSALARERDDSQSWRSLGIAWGRLGEMGQADLALAEEALVLGDIPRARTLARRAEKQLPQGPSRQRAVDVGNAVRKENREGF